jgi:hypothetical protein
VRFVPPLAYRPPLAPTTTNESIRTRWCVFYLQPHTAHLNQHQRVLRTRWCVIPLQPHTARFNRRQRVLKDSLVCFFTSNPTPLASTTTNESLGLVDVLSPSNYPPLASTTTNESLRTRWCVFLLPPPTTRLNHHQRVLTDSLVCFLPPTPHRSPQPTPTSP